MNRTRDTRPAETPNSPAPGLAQIQEAAELRRSLRRFLAHGDATVRRCGLTPQRYLLLLAVKGAPDGSESRSIGEIADDLQLAQSSATGLVDRAEAVGLVARTLSPTDGRVVRLMLTAEGERRLAEAFTALSGDRDELLAHLEHAGRALARSRPSRF